MCIHTCVCISVYVCMYARMARRGRMHMYIYTHIYTHTHKHTYTHTYIHTHIHTYIHIGVRELNTKGVRAWQDGVPCIWRRVGVWDLVDQGTTTGQTNQGTTAGQTNQGTTAGQIPVLFKSDHFARVDGCLFGKNEASFVDRFLVPFYKAFIKEIRSEMSGMYV